jgi:4-amino-4-deoxy-L-arabinose transferase-like glycosyltransferase
MNRLRSLPPALLWAPLLGLAALALSAATGGLSHSFLDPDESAHYVNTLFIADWLRAGLPSPMPFARDFYAHFPKLSIGHWPPGWYALLAPLFAVLRPSPFGAAILSAIIAGLPALLIVWALDRAGARRWGIVAAFAYLLLPLVANEARYCRIDQPVALVTGLAAIAWFRATERPGLWRYLLFGALAAFATLTKGNGALAVLIPALDILMARRWRQLADWRLWVAAAATLLVVAPWYYVSFKISAGGFNYAPGPAYAWLSLKTDAAAILATLGVIGILAASFGAVAGWQEPNFRPIVRLSIAAILATLLFQAAIPVALEDRYVLPAIPWLVVLIVIGPLAAAERNPIGAIIPLVVIVAALVPFTVDLAHQPPKPDIDAPAIAARMQAAPGIWLVDGRAGGEGAVIAEAAFADGGRRAIWAARASQWLSTSDFMGRGYALSVHSPAEARGVLDKLGVRGVVSIAEKGDLAYPHSALLRAAVGLPGFAATDRPFRRGAGSALVASRMAPIAAHPDLLSSGSGSADVAAMGKAF